MPKHITALKIDGVVYGKIQIRPKGVVFALCDPRGMHVSVTKKAETKFHVEVSSDERRNSVWDEARIGVARGLGWRSPERHTNYIVNREYSIPPPFDPLHIVSFARPSEVPAQKARYSHLPSLELQPNGIWDELEISLQFTEPSPAFNLAGFAMGWTTLLFLANKSKTERNRRANALPRAAHD